MRLPSSRPDVKQGDTACYYWWREETSDWTTDGVPRLVLEADAEFATVLMEGGPIRLPISLLKKF